MRRFSFAVRTILAFLFLAGVAQAAELKVISSDGLTEVLNVLGPLYEKETGNKLVVHYDVANVLKKDIMDGEAFDVTLLTGPVMDDVIKADKVLAATRVEIARAGVGIAYKIGEPRPDIHDAAAFKRALLAAKSIAYITKGASGLYFLSVCERLGIADQVKAKSRALPGGHAADLVASGEVELATQLASDLLPVAGVEVIAFPPELQKFILFSGAVGSAAKQPEGAATLIKFLSDPKHVPLIKAKGMEGG